jgi:type I restriction enzyme, S subunit
MARVGDLAEQVRGVTYGKEDASATPLSGYLPVLRAGNITDDGLVFSDLVFVPAERISDKQKVRRHDVVVAASSGSLDVVGKTAPALCDFDGGFGAFCKVLRPNAKVHPAYFAQFFKTQNYRRRVSALAAGANINNLRNEHLDEMKMPLPPLPEQRRIAEILDKADALRAKRRAALAQLDTLTQSIFLDMFGDPATNPKQWPLTRLGDLCEEVIDCPHSTPVYSTERTPYLCVRSSDIQNGALDFRETKYVARSEYDRRVARGKPVRGDVIYCREGARFGNAARVIDDRLLCLGQRMMLLRPKLTVAVSEYIWAFLSSTAGYRQAACAVDGSAAPHVNIREIVAFRLPVPPIDHQRDFARQIAVVGQSNSTHRSSLAEFDALFASLQHRAFQGCV